MLTVTKLGLPPELRRSLACTNIIENVRHGAARLPEREILALAVHGFTLDWRRHAGSRQGIQAVKAYKQLPLLQAALAARKARAASSNEHLVKTAKAA